MNKLNSQKGAFGKRVNVIVSEVKAVSMNWSEMLPNACVTVTKNRLLGVC